MSFFMKMFGNYSEKEIKRIIKIQQSVLLLEDEYKALSDDELKGKTADFKERHKNGETLDDLLPEAFAAVREAADRVLGMKHFPVQILGGIILHQGRIAEMKTGEGKTLVSTLPAYLNAIMGSGVHIVTVNDYLAKRDSEWMGKIYHFLGLSVGLVVHDKDNEERQEAYRADITYGTNNEMGFDYLRDNMVIYKEQMVQRGHVYAIVDEVDSILIDEARTPLIISGVGDQSTKLYEQADAFAKRLKRKVVVEEDTKVQNEETDADYIVDEKAKNVTLTVEGIKKAEQVFGIENLSDPENMTISHHINQALRAHGIMKIDKDYVVQQDGQVVIVDEFTGRLMQGRRYSDGLHQAIEAKEKVKVQRESKTLATITFQNYFRLYKKLAGMTGTALTEEKEFQDIYKMDVVEIPTNMPMVRKDLEDVVYRTEKGKFEAVVDTINEAHQKGQPVLVGTITIEKSEELSSMLKKRGVPHNVLNAKQHEKEAEIVAQAGKKGSVTIATNMAGRGTDIVLGGNSEFMAKHEMKKRGYSEELISESTGFSQTEEEEILEARKTFKELEQKYKQQILTEREMVISLGGLFIIGTERHESRRIDNQLRGRAGRQGDPGTSRFFISMEDDIMRLFGSDKYTSLIDAVGMDDTTPLEMGMLTKAIETAQRRVEGRNFDIRKHVLQYDDVMNKQREMIYEQRRKVIDGENLKDSILKMVEDFVSDMVDKYTAGGEFPDDWNFAGLIDAAQTVFLKKDKLQFSKDDFFDLTKEKLKNILLDEAYKAYEEKETEVTPDYMRELERVVMLQVVDNKWMDHIDEMEQLKQGIGLRAYGQSDPVVEYKIAGFDMFDQMVFNIRIETVRFIFGARLRAELKREEVAKPIAAGAAPDGAENAGKKPYVNKNKVGRNDSCPCGSGKKFKKCCGQ